MPITRLGKKVEREIDPFLREIFDKYRNSYLFEIEAPGTRTEADFRVQVNIYSKEWLGNGNYLARRVGYVKVSQPKLKTLDVPMFFEKAAREIDEYIGRLEKACKESA